MSRTRRLNLATALAVERWRHNPQTSIPSLVAHALTCFDRLAALRGVGDTRASALGLGIEGLIAVDLACGRTTRRLLAEARSRTLVELDAWVAAVRRTGPPAGALPPAQSRPSK